MCFPRMLPLSITAWLCQDEMARQQQQQQQQQQQLRYLSPVTMGLLAVGVGTGVAACTATSRKQTTSTTSPRPPWSGSILALCLLCSCVHGVHGVQSQASFMGVADHERIMSVSNSSVVSLSSRFDTVVLPPRCALVGVDEMSCICDSDSVTNSVAVWDQLESLGEWIQSLSSLHTCLVLFFCCFLRLLPLILRGVCESPAHDLTHTHGRIRTLSRKLARWRRWRKTRKKWWLEFPLLSSTHHACPSVRRVDGYHLHGHAEQNF